MLGLAGLSYGFPYGVDVNSAPLALYIGLALFAGGLWGWIALQLRRDARSIPALWIILGLGLFMRAVMFVSLPVLEDDSYRYLWDGAVTANGIDPYAYAPADVATDGLFSAVHPDAGTRDFERLQALAETHAVEHSRINYPFVSTIYPPLAQAAFAAAHWIDPFGLTGWRFILLLSDLLTFALLLRVLKVFQRPAIWISLYWWNPVVILQGFGAGHMDTLVVPFLLSALLLAKSQRVGWASLALAGGAAVKLWPILLFPVLLRPYLRHPIKAAAYALVFGLSVSVLLLPQAWHALAPDAGVNAYASDWRTHAFLFAILEDFALAWTSTPSEAARLSVAALLVGLTGVLALRDGNRVENVPRLWAVVITALIFLSPTGYPWYLIWLAPFLPFLPASGVIALFVLAPLYWLRFQLGDDVAIYQWGIVPIAFGVPLALIALPFVQRRLFDAFRHHHPRFE